MEIQQDAHHKDTAAL